MNYISMKSNIILNKLVGRKQSREIDNLLGKYEENINYMQWIKETIQKFQEDRIIMNNRPQPLESYDHEKKKFIEQDFAKFVGRLYEIELDTICENEEIISKIAILNKSNEEKASIKMNEKSEDLDKDHSNSEVISVIYPRPYECCKEIWCTCYSKLTNEKDDSEYEEYWSKYYEQYVDKLVEDDQF